MKSRHLLTAVLFFIFEGSIQQLIAQPGKIDLTFNVADSGRFGNGPASQVFDMLYSNAGQIWLGGPISFNFDQNFKNIVRVDSVDGALDHSYAATSTANGAVKMFLRQADGKFYAVGTFTSFGGLSRNGVARVKADGIVDSSFNPGTGTSVGVNAIVQQSDGKLILVGNFTTFAGVASVRIVRLNQDGSRDGSFITGTGANSEIFGLAIQPDGKIIIAGSFTSFNGTPLNRLARLNTDGSLDNSFQIGTGLNNPGRVIKLAPDGKIYVGGDFSFYNQNFVSELVRLLPDGTYDAFFNNSLGGTGIVYALQLLPDGRLLAGGTMRTYNGESIGSILRILPDGSRDITFNPGSGMLAASPVRCFLPAANGKIIIGGTFGSYNDLAVAHLIRVDSTGKIDKGFLPIPGANKDIVAAIVQPDQKLIIAGAFTRLNNELRSHLGRLNADGSLDTTFNTSVPLDDYIQAVAVQSTGKVLYGSSYINSSFLRVNSDGSADPGFLQCDKSSGEYRQITILTGDSILVNGDFAGFRNPSIGNQTGKYIVKLAPNGALDPSFTMPFNNPVWNTAIQPDGKILAFGSFGAAIGNNFVRLNRNGTQDPTLNAGTGFSSGTFGTVSHIVVQPDGKIISIGTFTTYNGLSFKYMIRLLSNGAVDLGFNAGGSGFNSYPSAIILQSDGKIVVGGGFTSYNAVAARGLIRLNSDGSIDNCFNLSTASDSYSLNMVLQNPNAAIVYDDVTTYQGLQRDRIVRVDVTSCTIPVTLLDFTANSNGNQVNLQWSTASEQNSSYFEVERSLDGMRYQTVATVAAAGNSVTARKYQSVDLLNGISNNTAVLYYRLKMLNADGSFRYSNVVVIRLGQQQNKIRLAANPVHDNLQLQYFSGAAASIHASIVNSGGSILSNADVWVGSGNNSIMLSTASLPAGVYLLRLLHNDKVESIKFIKN